MFLFALVALFKLIEGKRLGNCVDIIIGNIGKQSMLMWFIHCVFFNMCGKVFKPILYLPHNPILVLIWGLFICYVFAIILRIFINALYKLLELRYNLRL